MLTVGLTGGIGSGKTLCCAIFEFIGVPVFYSDTEAKELMVGDPGVKEEIMKIFGEESYLEDGTLNRAFLAKCIFQKKELLRKMNAIVHPAVRSRFNLFCDGHHDEPYVIQESAILMETGLYEHFDRVILVDAPESLRIQRVMARDQVAEAAVRRRIENQWPSQRKRDLADFIIDNDGRHSLLQSIIRIHRTLLDMGS